MQIISFIMKMYICNLDSEVLDIPTLKLNDYEPKEIAKIFREWSEETQEEFAKNLNKKARSIQHYEGGTRQITLSTILKIAKLYDIEIIARKK